MDVQQSNGIVVSNCRVVVAILTLSSLSTEDDVSKFSIDLTSPERFLPMPDVGEQKRFEPFDVE